MNLEQKKELVGELQNRMKNAGLVVVADYRGLKVNDATAFRKELRKAGIEIEVIKNTMTRRAIADTPMEKLGDLLPGMTAVLTSGEDAIGAAKTVREQAKKYEAFKVKGGFFDGDILDAKGVEKVADLPSKAELQAKMLATLLESPRKVLRVLQAPGRDLVYLLKNYERKLESSG